MMSSLFDLVGRISVNMSGFDEAMNDVRTRTDGVAGYIGGVGDNVTSIGKKMTLGVTAPVAGILGASLKSAIDLESAFAGVRKTVDVAGESAQEVEANYEKLRKGIIEMTREVPASAEAISGVAEAAGQLGIAEKDILAFSRVIIDLGEATDMTGEIAATQFARFANISGMAQTDYDRLGSALVNLGNNVAATESEIMALSMRLIGQTSQIGINEHQTLALAAAMKQVGINAEAGGTAMTTIMKKMQSAVGANGKELAKWAKVAGVSGAEFKKVFEKDAILAIDMFIKGLGKAKDKGENLSEILTELNMKGVYEQDTLLRLAGAQDVLSDALVLSEEGWRENSALTEEAAERYKTTASQIQILKNNTKELSYEIGAILIPIFLEVLDAIRPLIEWFAGLSDETKKTIVIMGLLAAALGPVLIAVGSVVRAISSIVRAISGVMKVGGRLVGGLRTAATSGLSMGRVFRLLGKSLLRFIPYVGVLITVVEGLIFVFDQFGIDIVSGFIEGVKGAGKMLVEGAKWIFDTFVNYFKDLFGINSPSVLFKQFGSWVMEGFLNGLIELMNDILMAIGTFGSNFVAGFTGFLGNTLTAIGGFVSDTISSFWRMVTGVLTSLGNMASNAYETVGRMVRNVISTIGRMVSNVISSVGRMVGNVLGALGRMASNAIGAASRMATGVATQFGRMVSAAWRAGANVATAIGTGINNAINVGMRAASGAAAIGSNIASGIASGVRGAVGAVTGAVSWVSGKAVGAFKAANKIKSPSRLYKAEAVWLPRGIAAGIMDGLPTVESAMDALSEAANQRYNVDGPEVAVDAVATYGGLSVSGGGPGEQGSRSGVVVQGNLIVDVKQVTDMDVNEIQRKASDRFFQKAKQMM